MGFMKGVDYFMLNEHLLAGSQNLRIGCEKLLIEDGKYSLLDMGLFLGINTIGLIPSLGVFLDRDFWPMSLLFASSVLAANLGSAAMLDIKPSEIVGQKYVIITNEINGDLNRFVISHRGLFSTPNSARKLRITRSKKSLPGLEKVELPHSRSEKRGVISRLQFAGRFGYLPIEENELSEDDINNYQKWLGIG